VSCVIFDEFHERGAEADLALALVRQARELLRPDLRLLVMSATLDLAPLAERLPEACVIASEGRSHPVSLAHQPPRPGERLDQQLVRALEGHWLPEREAGETVLVFLPGQREIAQAQRAIEACAWSADLECVALHGQLSLADQARAIRPAAGPGAKVVLATAIAESSLTIAAVRLVIDSGLRRCSRFDPCTGMDGLVTVPASLASAEQRRGRAGRLGPGHCLRLWSPAEQQRRPAFDPPELLETDPVPIALQLACWGSPLGEDLPWLDPPPRPGLLEARELLQQLGALDHAGQLSRHGRALARLGLHPRLGHLLLRGAERGWLDLACPLAVLLSERDPLDRRTAGSDLLRRLDWLRQGGDRSREAQRRPLLQLAERLRRQLQPDPKEQPEQKGQTDQAGPDPGADDAIAARLLSWAYPERVALRRGHGGGRFLMRGGRGACLHPDDPLAAATGLAIAAVDGQGAEARVQLAVALPDGVLEELVAEEGTQECRADWDGEAQRVRCERLLRLGALVLERRPWPEADTALVRSALLEGVRQLGLAVLPWGRASRQLQARLSLAHRHLGPPWPDRDDAALERDLETWLGPHLDGLRSRQELQMVDLCQALWGDLPWERRQELSVLLPEELARAFGPAGGAALRARGGGAGREAPGDVRLRRTAGTARRQAGDHGGTALTGRSAGGDHPRPGRLLAERLRRGAAGAAGSLSTPSLAGGSQPGPRHRPHQGGAEPKVRRQRQPPGSEMTLQQGGEAEVAQALHDAFAALAAGVEHVGQPGQRRHQGRLRIAHHHAGQAGLEHREVVEGVAGGDHQGRIDLQPAQQGEQGGALVHPSRQHIEVAVVGNQAIDPVGLDGGEGGGIEPLRIDEEGQPAIGAHRLGRHAGDPGDQRQQALGQTLPAAIDRLHHQGHRRQAQAAGHGATHIADHEMGWMQAEAILLIEQAGHRTQVPAGAEHMQHLLTAGHQPGIEAAATLSRAAEQGAVEIGHQHQLRAAGQARRQLALQALTQRRSGEHGSAAGSPHSVAAAGWIGGPA
jgi:ATP-dependent helicase HrpB